MESRIGALEKANVAGEVALDKRLAAECKALDARFAAMDRALGIATGEQEKRWDAANEFRESLKDSTDVLKEITLTLPRRIEFDDLRNRVNTMMVTLPLHDALEKRINAIESWQDRQEGKASQASVMIAYLISGVSLLLGVATFIIERTTR